MELIKITEQNGKKLVSARELHSFLEVGANVNDWMKRQAERAMLDDGIDFIAILGESNGGRPSTDYALTLSAAKEISMLNGGEKGKQARLYFIECEKQVLSSAPKTLKEALLLAVKMEEEKEQLALQVAEQKPYVIAFNRVIENATTYTLDTLSDILNVGRTTLSNKLKSLEWSMQDSSKGTSSTRYAEVQGYAKTIFDTKIVNGTERPIKKIVLTRKGLDKLIAIYNQ